MMDRLARLWRPLRGFALVGGAILILPGGCPIDADDLTTSVVQAALESITDSVVSALSAYLAGS